MPGWTVRTTESRTVLLVGIALICVAIWSSLQIARDTVLNSHPDEMAHVDAFCYFQGRWWPPDLNEDGLLYSGYGWSRVYTGEVVYIAYGNAYRSITSGLHAVQNRRRTARSAEEVLAPAEHLAAPNHVFLPSVSVYRLVDLACRQVYFRDFRYMNVALYVLTLIVALAAGRRAFWTFSLFVALASVPQITYLYSYANSDAWGISASVFLVLYAVYLARSPRFRAVDAVGLGLLTGMVLLTKKPYWVTIPFAYLFLIEPLYGHMRGARAADALRLIVSLGLVAVTIAIVAGPLQLYYPWTQGDFAAGELAMREQRAIEGFKPSNTTADGVRLASRGEPFRAVWADPAWWGSSGKSAYGLFGVMAIRLPMWMYLLPALAALLGIGLTLLSLGGEWQSVPIWTKIVLAAAPLLIGLNVFASLYNSWVIDHQAQGRYLLPALLPLAFLWGGLYELESVRVQQVRWLLLAIICVAGLTALWSFGIDSARYFAP